MLRSKPPTPVERRAAAEHAAEKLPIVTDRRASEEYRRHLVATLIERAVQGVLALPNGGPG
jgi:CO/xanthine dehydrogenase FAD-binding subunit